MTQQRPIGEAVTGISIKEPHEDLYPVLTVLSAETVHGCAARSRIPIANNDTMPNPAEVQVNTLASLTCRRAIQSRLTRKQTASLLQKRAHTYNMSLAKTICPS